MVKGLFCEVISCMFIYLSRTVDFVLKDPREKSQPKPLPKAPHRLELDVVPKPWAKDVQRATAAMSQTLFVTNPTLNAILSLWYRSYSGVRLVSPRALVTQHEAFQLAAFQGLVMRDMESVRGMLLKK